MNTADDFTSMLTAPPKGGASIAEIARQYLRRRDDLDAAKTVQAEAQRKLDSAESALIAALDMVGLKSVKLDGLGKGPDWLVTAATKTDYRLPAQSEEVAYAGVLAWLVANGGEALVKQAVAWQSFSSFVHERVADGQPVPGEIKANTRRVVSVRRS